MAHLANSSSELLAVCVWTFCRAKYRRRVGRLDWRRIDNESIAVHVVGATDCLRVAAIFAEFALVPWLIVSLVSDELDACPVSTYIEFFDKKTNLLQVSVFAHSVIHSLKSAAINSLMVVVAPWEQHCM